MAILLALSAAADPAPGATLVVRYPNTNGMAAQSLGYRMLGLALRSTGRPFRIELQTESANTDRVRALLESGAIDVMDLGSTPEFEQRFTAVYFPIDRGLNGWRLLVIRKADRAAFARTRTLADLAAFTAGQGQGWPDADILRGAGLRVETFPQLDSLFRSLEAGRFDYLPLGMNEAMDLARHYASRPDVLFVDTHLVIVYPFGRLFFVRKGNVALRDLLMDGLRKAFANGSLQKLLADDPGYAEVLRRGAPTLKLHADNPRLSAAFRAIPDEYFLR